MVRQIIFLILQIKNLSVQVPSIHLVLERVMSDSFMTLWTVALQDPLSMGFSRQEYWSGLPRPPPGDLPDPGIEPVSPMSPALAGGFLTASATWEALLMTTLST